MDYNEQEFNECKDKLRQLYGLAPYYDTNSYDTIKSKYSDSTIALALQELGLY